MTSTLLSLSVDQEKTIGDVIALLGHLSGVAGIVLGGSHARGRARPDSDIDLGVFYSEGDRFDISALRKIARVLNDDKDPVVSDFYEWGPWVNGGAWLTIQGQRVDLLYRSIEQCDAVILDARRGQYHIHYGQQPPFGFFSPTYLGEMFVARPLDDKQGDIARLKLAVKDYPEALRQAVIQNCLWGVEFGLAAFAPKFALKNDVYNTASCISRFSYYMVLALFALNRRYFLNDKTALEEVREFERKPDRFEARITALLGKIGTTPRLLQQSLAEIESLFEDCVALAGDSYQSRRVP